MTSMSRERFNEAVGIVFDEMSEMDRDQFINELRVNRDSQISKTLNHITDIISDIPALKLNKCNTESK